jgi:nucleoside-diphosphate-sugar epimerase
LNKKILVTGGAGYVGLELIENLLSKNFQVICYDNFLYKNILTIKKFKNKNFQYIKSDIRDLKTLSKILPQINTVIHLAAIVGDLPCKVIPDLSYEINFLSTINLAKICKKYSVENFIFASTCSNYGIVNPDIPAKEDSELNPISLYAETKIDSELKLEKIANKNMQIICLRFGTAFGASHRTRFDLLLNSLLFEAMEYKSILVHSLDTWRPYIHVSDMANIIHALLKKTLEDNFTIFNAGFTSLNYKKREIVQKIKRCLPNLTVKVASDQTDFRNYRVDFSKIEETLKLKPEKDVEKGIIEFIKKYKSGKVNKSTYIESNLKSLQNYLKKNAKFLEFKK